VTGFPFLGHLLAGSTSASNSHPSSPATAGSPISQAVGGNVDQTLLHMLEDSFNEFRNSLDKKKQPSSIRKAIKDYRCHQAMIAALNAADPALNAHYCDGEKELDRLLRQIAAEPEASTHRVLLKAGAHNVAIEIRNDASGNIAVLCLDSIGHNTGRSDAFFKELKRTIEKHRGAHGVMVSLDVQRTRLDCAIHAIYALLQLKEHQGEITVRPPVDANNYNFSWAPNENIPLPVDFFGLMDSENAWNELLEKRPALANELLSDSNKTLAERIEKNEKTVTLSPSVLERFFALRDCDLSDCGSAGWQHTYANSAELFRTDLYRQTIDWVKNTPKSEVRSDIDKIRPVKPGYEMLKRFPLTKAREPVTPYRHYRLNPDVTNDRAQERINSSAPPSLAESSVKPDIEQQDLNDKELPEGGVRDFSSREAIINLKKKPDTASDPGKDNREEIQSMDQSTAESEAKSIESLYTSYIKKGWA
jgi:hypothetical protein